MNDDVSQRSRGIKTCNPGHAHRLTIAASLLLQRTISPCRSPSLCVLMSVSLPLSLSNTFHQISSGEQLPSGFFKTWVLSGKSGPRFFFPTGDEWNHCDRGMRHRRQQDGGSHWLPAGFLFCSRWYWFFIRKIKTGQPVLTWCQCCLLHPLLPTCRIWDTLASSWFVLGRHVSSEQCATGFCAYASIASTSSVISYSQTYLHNGRSWVRNVFKKAERLHNNRLFCA